MILYLASDLLWATRIKATADDLHLLARPVRNLDMLDARLKETEPAATALILDLEAEEMAFALLNRIRGAAATPRERAIRVVAFAPHVKVDLMRAVKAAGADEVMPRGAFDHGLGRLLESLSRRA